jgi:predicted permease
MFTPRNGPTPEKASQKNLTRSLCDPLGQDFRYALRQIWRAPGFALTVTLTLALGMGTNLAIFQLLYGVLFRQLPVVEPSQLYSLHAVKSPFDGQWFFSYPAYQRLQTSTANSALVLARSGISEGLLERQSEFAARVSYQLVSGNFFDVLGVSPVSGRFFEASDKESALSAWPVVLRYGYWRESFGADRSIIGKRAAINGVPIVVVGIAPDRFSGVVAGQFPDVWLPLEAQASTRFSFWFDSLGPGSGANIQAPYMNQQNVYWLWLMARVPDEAKSSSVAQWTEVLRPDLALLAGASKEARDRERIVESRVQLISAATGEGTLREDYGQALILLMIMAALVFLAGCVNLANLQLSRLLSRRREFVVRTALGASRWRISRQLLVEDALLVSIGAALALAVGKISSSLLLQYASGSEHGISLDLRTGWELSAVGAALLLAALAAFSVLPAWHITGGHLAGAMTARSSSPAWQGKSASRWSSVLLATQLSLSVPLLAVAGLFAQTLRNLDQVDTGLDRDHVISVHLDLANAGYEDRNLPDLYRRMLARLKQLTGVRDAAVSMCAIPGCVWNTAIHVYGHPEITDAQVHGEENHVGAGYFATLGIPILQGREFEERDSPASQRVAILNHAFAKKLFGKESPIGHRIGYQPAPRDADYVIVGEVADARVDDLRSPAPPIAYFSIDQRPASAETIEVRASGRPGALSSTIRQELLAVDGHLPITKIISLREEYDEGLSREKLLARLTGAFGFLAEALAALGFYGLVSFNVTRRTAEIGIRMAVGATPAQIRALVVRQTLWIFISGILSGIILAEAASRGARALVYGSAAIDFWALGFAVCILGVVGILAAWRPARRAAMIDPVEALRAE